MPAHVETVSIFGHATCNGTILTRAALDSPFWHLKDGFNQSPTQKSRSELILNRRTQNILDNYSR